MKKREKKEALTLADAISASRFFFGVLVFLLLIKGKFLFAIIFYFIGVFTDFLDGQVARRFHETSKLGGTLDAVADRFLVAMTVIGLIIAGQLNPLMKTVFLIWLVGEALLAVITAIKTRSVWIISVHRNSIRFAAFFGFMTLGWTMLNWQYLNIWFWLLMFFVAIATIDYAFWLQGKKWQTWDNIERKLKSSFFGNFMN